MATGRFEDFNIDITFVDGSKNTYEIQVTDSPSGQTGKIRVVFSLDERMFQREKRDLKKWLDKPEQIRELGKRLYGMLFPGNVATWFEESRRIQKTKKEMLRVRVRTNRPELLELPWEFCYEERAGQFVARQPETPFVRYVTGRHSNQDICMTPPIRLLVAIAAPEDQVSLDSEGEERHIREALKDLEPGTVDWRIVHSATARDLHTAILKHEPNILHYSGHGTKGALLMEDLLKLTRELTGEQVGSLLSRPYLKLVVLNACETGAYDIGGELMGVAADLIREEIPAVVAMQFPVPEGAALAFTRRFYATIALGKSLEQAVTEARISIFTESNHPVYWGIPVLFSRAPDGTILPDIHVATEGLKAFHEGIQLLSEAKAAAAGAAQDIREVCETIDELGHYKTLHDQLHKLQWNCYDCIVQLVRRPVGDLDYSEVDQYKKVLEEVIHKSKEVASKTSFAPLEISWIADAVKADDFLVQAIDRLQPEPLMDVIWHLNRVLTSSPSNVDTGLFHTADDLKLSILVEAMGRVSLDRALDSTLVSRYKVGQEALRNLDRRLVSLLDDHHHWQIVDHQLRRIESELRPRESGIGQGIEDLKRTWPGLKREAEPLYSDSIEDWARELRKLGHNLDSAIAADNPDSVIDSFRHYRRQAGLRFLTVDEELKHHCEELRRIGAPLVSVLEVLS